MYRPDIDGLRAVAVLAVVVFHALPFTLPGGFVGVDIFFVISGFLISGIILRELERGRFTVAGFYERRIRRIFPALTLVLTAVLVIGWAILGPLEFRQLARHTLGGAGFFSNLLLWREVGYFDLEAQSKPLLHLWSLGIEEQFYIAWPLTLAFLFRRVRNVLPAIAILAAASFAVNVVKAGPHPDAAYYNPASRVWELLIGAALACFIKDERHLLSPGKSDALSILGGLMIAASFFVIDERSLFPGWIAILPTVGAALVIAAGSQALINKRILSLRGAVLVGKISFPLYLWHWPLLVFFKLTNDSDLHWGRLRLIRLSLMTLACVLAWATWRFWETPVRQSKSIAGLPTVRTLAGAMVAVCGMACVIVGGWQAPRLNGPVEERIFQSIADWENAPFTNYGHTSYRTYELRPGSSAYTLFVGDSHAEHYLPWVKSALDRDHTLSPAAFATYGNCIPLPHLNRTTYGFHCPQFYDYWTSEARRAKTIVVSAYWESYPLPPPSDRGSWRAGNLINAVGEPATAHDIAAAWQEFGRTLQSLRLQGKRVILISSTAESQTFDPLSALRRLGHSDLSRITPVKQDQFESYLSPFEEKLRSVAAFSGAELVRPVDYFCRGGVCPAVDDHGEPLYRDDNHLRAHVDLPGKDAFIQELLRQ